jgi:antitoxin component YwqK of YwqJK toxin-antitoxin module
LEGEGEYKNGKKDGTWTFYDKEGVKEKEILFADGLDTLHTYYSSNGNKMKEGKMVDGKEEGNWTFYDENGVKERETEHKSAEEKRLAEEQAAAEAKKIAEEQAATEAKR